MANDNTGAASERRQLQLRQIGRNAQQHVNAPAADNTISGPSGVQLVNAGGRNARTQRSRRHPDTAPVREFVLPHAADAGALGRRKLLVDPRRLLAHDPRQDCARPGTERGRRGELVESSRIVPRLRDGLAPFACAAARCARSASRRRRGLISRRGEHERNRVVAVDAPAPRAPRRSPTGAATSWPARFARPASIRQSILARPARSPAATAARRGRDPTAARPADGGAIHRRQPTRRDRRYRDVARRPMTAAREPGENRRPATTRRRRR